MRASVNNAIGLRGLSGTARATGLIVRALQEMGVDVELLSPAAPGKRKLVNALRATAWDFRGFDRESSGDLLISPTNVGLTSRHRPHLLWVHDTMVLDHPEWFDKAYAMHARLTFGPSITRATAIATPSENTRRRLVRRWPAVERRAHVIPWPATGETARARTALPSVPEVLMLGATEPHKRHVLGIEAVRLLRILTGTDVQLQIVGPRGRAERDVVRRLSLVDPEGKWTYRTSVPDRAEVDMTLRNCWLLLQCSLDEGFCLPLVEASTQATPAIHTGCGAMAEVHPRGNCDSSNPRVLAERMRDLLDETTYAAESEAAVGIAERHSWRQFRSDLELLLKRVHPCA